MHEFFFHFIFPCANILFRTSLPISDKFSNGQSFSELKLTNNALRFDSKLFQNGALQLVKSV